MGYDPNCNCEHCVSVRENCDCGGSPDPDGDSYRALFGGLATDEVRGITRLVEAMRTAKARPLSVTFEGHLVDAADALYDARNADDDMPESHVSAEVRAAEAAWHIAHAMGAIAKESPDVPR